MATKTINTKICQPSNTRAGFGTVVLARYQLAYETDTDRLKVGIGEGITYPAQPYAELETPVGTTVEMMCGTIPTGYLAQNGQAVSRTTYGALFNVIGTTYGAGNGSTTFNLPNANTFASWGTTTDSQVGTTNGTYSHYHGSGNYVGNCGAVNGNPGSFGYEAVGRDATGEFDAGVYTWIDTHPDPAILNRRRGNIAISYVSHSTSCSNVNSTIVDQVPDLFRVNKVIKY